MARPKPPPRPDVREDSVREALAIIAQDGVERLSLREVARRLGVSHQAPYKHYPSRDHLLAEVVGRAFDGFARHLDAATAAHSEPRPALEAMGRAYLSYAAERPLEYRLMFGTPLPDPQQHPEMVAKASHAFGLLRSALAALHRAEGRADALPLADKDALHVWATMHGLATILRHCAIEVLGLPEGVLAQAPGHAFARLSAGLSAEP